MQRNGGLLAVLLFSGAFVSIATDLEGIIMNFKNNTASY
jgi:hypothetical protein